VVFATDYPFLDIFWTMIIFFCWVAWFTILFRVIGDLFRRHDIGGGQKVLWMAFVIILPFLGVFVYLIAQSEGMAQRGMDQAREQHARFEAAYGDSAGGAATQIAEAKKLLDSGVVTQTEFDAMKAKALA
jgi:Phospholipase_D-nuclease N-terminal/Short C-terminal domain